MDKNQGRMIGGTPQQPVNDAELAAIAATIEAEKARASAFAETPIARRIAATLDFARHQHVIVAVAGGSGVGKSTTLAHYARRHPNVWRCEFNSTSRSPCAVLTVIAEALGLHNLPSRPDVLFGEVKRFLARTRGLLICDEAQHLTKDGFETVRGIFDALGEGPDPIGVAFAGHLDLMDKIARLSQLAGRLCAPLRIPAATPADADALFDAWGLRGPTTRQYLRGFAGGSMGLRRIANAYKLAVECAFADGVPVEHHHVRRAWEGLAGGLAA